MVVEMFFTHKVDADKQKKLVAIGWPTVEIALSNLDQNVDFEAIEGRVLHSVEHKHWLHHPGEFEAQEVLRA